MSAANIGIAESGADGWAKGRGVLLTISYGATVFKTRISLKKLIGFQNRVQWLGGRFSNAPPSAIPGR